MPWVRFDDTFPVHRKVDGLSDAAFRLHVSAIFWCARNLTDGVVPEEDLDLVTARVRTPARFAAELVRRGLWDKRDQGGWIIHDYLDFQPSKDKVLAERRSNADRQAKWRDRHKPLSGNGVSNGVSNRGSNAAPTRPEGSVVQVVPRGKAVTRARDAPLEPQPEPPRRCAQHLDDPDPPNCGPCGDARRRHERWQVGEAERQRTWQKCRNHPGQPAHACGLCRSERIAQETA